MNWFSKIGCRLIGWNPEILRSCSEASYKTLRRYTSALIILMFLWASIGYLFTEQYLKAPLWGRIAASFIFMVVIVLIERQIILQVGKNKAIGTVRFILAFLMAIIGATIIDQIIFKDDIQKTLVEIRDQEVKKMLPNRIATIEARLNVINRNIDSLDQFNLKLSDELAKRPTIKSTQTESRDVPVVTADGTTEMKKAYNVTTIDVENPRKAQLDNNTKLVAEYRAQVEQYTAQMMNAETNLRNELESKTGFLEELSAIILLLRQKPVAFAFYMLVLGFFLLLELMILFSKHNDQKCDYEMVVEHQLHMKKIMLEELVRSRTEGHKN